MSPPGGTCTPTHRLSGDYTAFVLQAVFVNRPPGGNRTPISRLSGGHTDCCVTGGYSFVWVTGIAPAASRSRTLRSSWLSYTQKNCRVKWPVINQRLSH